MALFFLLFAVSLFLPQHIRGLEEAYWSLSSVAVLIGVFRAPKPVSKALLLSWIGVLLSGAVSTLFSRSPAASVLLYVKLLTAFAVFIAASGWEGRVTLFSRYLLLLARWAIIFVLSILSIQYFRHVIPPYNSLIAVNGHHPLAYLLIFIVPFIISARAKTGLIDRVLGVLGLLISNARGAWVVVAFYTIVTSCGRRIPLKEQLRCLLVGSFIIAAVAVMFWLSVLPYEQKMSLLTRYPIAAYFVKNSDDALRVEFMRQAIDAARRSPLVGTGPGTFELLSRQYQSAPSRFTAYAHSFPLETLAETGLLGLVALAVLMIVTIRMLIPRVIRPQKPEEMALAWSVLLAFIYSLFEGNLSTYSYWMLLWATIGLLTGGRRKAPAAGVETIVIALLGVLTVFGASFVLSHAPFLAPARSIALAPYRKKPVVDYLNGPKRPALPPGITGFWYRQDPDVIFAAAAQRSRKDAVPVLRQAIALDPHNATYRKALFLALWELHDIRALDDAICSYASAATKQPSAPVCAALALPSFAAYLARDGSLVPALQHLDVSDGAAKFFYFLGWDYYQVTEDSTGLVAFWQTARDIAPDWGHYHLELASALHYIRHDDIGAEKTLLACRKQTSARGSCATIGRSLDTLYPPGSLVQDIAAIPALLPE